MLKNDPIDVIPIQLYNPNIAEQVAETGKRILNELAVQLEQEGISILLDEKIALGPQG